MFQLAGKSKTKFGLLVTSVVLFGACSHKQVMQEAQSFQTPEPIIESEYQPSSQPVQSASYLKRKKKKTKYVKAKKASRHSVAKRAKRKPVVAATAQVNHTPPPPPPAEPMIPPPPMFEETASNASLWSRVAGHWGFWAVLITAAGLFGLVYRQRFAKGSRRRLVFN